MDIIIGKCNKCGDTFYVNTWDEIKCKTCDKTKCYVFNCNNVTNGNLFCTEEHNNFQHIFNKTLTHKKIIWY